MTVFLTPLFTGIFLFYEDFSLSTTVPKKILGSNSACISTFSYAGPFGGFWSSMLSTTGAAKLSSTYHITTF